MSSSFGRRDFINTALTFGAVGVASSELAAAENSPRRAAAPTSNYRFVNLNKILRGWDKAKKMQEDFQKEVIGKQEALDQKQRDFQKKSEELAALRKGGESEETRKR